MGEFSSPIVLQDIDYPGGASPLRNSNKGRNN